MHQAVERLTRPWDLIGDPDTCKTSSGTQTTGRNAVLRLQLQQQRVLIPYHRFPETSSLTSPPSAPLLFDQIYSKSSHLSMSTTFPSYSTHPNRPFIDSVYQGLWHGFWPYTGTSDPRYPTTWDNSSRPIHDPAHATFLSKQRDKGVLLECWSPAFGDTLLPRIYVTPLGVVPKPRSDKFRMVHDQSTGEFSLNSMINRANASLRLDGIRDLGTSICKALRGEDKNLFAYLN